MQYLHEQVQVDDANQITFVRIIVLADCFAGVMLVVSAAQSYLHRLPLRRHRLQQRGTGRTGVVPAAPLM